MPEREAPPTRPTAQKSAPQRKGGLGRGLAALIPTAPAQGDGGGPSTASRAASVVPGPTIPAPTQPRAAERAAESAAPVPVAGAVYREIELSAIQPNAKQPRTQFDEEALAELEHSIREFGLLQPIVVREVGSGSYELVMGERRWR